MQYKTGTYSPAPTYMDDPPVRPHLPRLQGLDRLTDNILARAQPKMFHGQYVSGSGLAAFAQAYCTVINKGQVPTISSTWQVRA